MKKNIICVFLIIAISLSFAKFCYSQGVRASDLSNRTDMENYYKIITIDPNSSPPSAVVKNITFGNFNKAFLNDITESTEIVSGKDLYYVEDPNTYPFLKKIDYINFINSSQNNIFVVDPNETDQGLTGNGKSIKAYVDSIGSKFAKILLKHTDPNNETDYLIETNETIPSNITLEIEPGAYIDGNATLTPYHPKNLKCSYNQKIFGSSITISFTYGGILSPKWWNNDIGDGSTAANTAFDSAETSFPAASGLGLGTIYIPAGDYVLNDWRPRTAVRYIGDGQRESRLVGTTSNVITGNASIEYCIFEDLGFMADANSACIDSNSYSYGHLTFKNCNFEGPSKYGVKGYIILTLFDHCSFGYIPNTEKLETAVYIDTAANHNTFNKCKFYRCTASSIIIASHGYGNMFYGCDFEELDDKAMEITQGANTKIRDCWFEDLNKVNNSENCVIEFKNGNAAINLIESCTLSGTKNNTDKFFYIGSNEPQIKFENNRITSTYTNLSIITLTNDNIFWYYSNKEEASGITIDGSYAYYTEIADNTGNISCLGFTGTALSGTWALSYSSYLPSLTRTSNQNSTEKYLFEVPLSLLTTTNKGIEPTSVSIAYEVTNADSGDDFGVALYTRELPIDGNSPEAVSAISASYDANHDTAAKRSNSAGGHQHNTMIKTLSSPSYLNTDGITFMVLLTATEADDATGALSLKIKDVILSYEISND